MHGNRISHETYDGNILKGKVELNMEKIIHQKYDILKQYLSGLGSVAIAFSGGVDSTFLLKTAHDVLGSYAIAVTARSCSFPERELREVHCSN